MFCPFCGVKNNPGQTACFVCAKKLPSLDTEGTPAARPRTLSRPHPSSGPRPARLGDRLIAVLLDSICLAALLLVGAAAIWWNRLIVPPVAVAIAGGLGLIFFYYWLLEGGFGATLGKAIIGVRVVSVDGGPSSFGSSATRNALRLVDGLPLYIPGFFVAVFSRSHRRLGDYVANTVVLEQPIAMRWRVAIVLLWLALIAGSLWGAAQLRPEWVQLLYGIR